MNIILKNSYRKCFNQIDYGRRFLSLSNIFRAAEGRMGYPSEKYEPTTIAALDKEYPNLPTITGLYEDGFMIAGRDRIIGAIFSFPKQIICWNVYSPDQITPESLALLEIVQPRPEIFVLGMGSRKNKVSPAVIHFLRSLKIGFEILPTTQACETFNFLLSDNRLAYAALFPQDDLVDQNYGLRKAIAHTQLYERDEEYIKTDMLRDSLDIDIKAYRERQLVRSHSPLDIKRIQSDENDDTNIKSLTDTKNIAKTSPNTNHPKENKK